MPLVYWGYSTKGQGSCTLFGVMVVMAHIAGQTNAADEWARPPLAVSRAL
jgi:hypothetical protein